MTRTALVALRAAALSAILVPMAAPLALADPPGALFQDFAPTPMAAATADNGKAMPQSGHWSDASVARAPAPAAAHASTTKGSRS